MCSTFETKEIPEDPLDHQEFVRPCTIYRYISPSGKAYVGRSIRPDERKLDHIRYQKNAEDDDFKKSTCNIFYRAVKKYGGFQNFTYSELFVCDECDGQYFENMLIANYGSLHPGGYNMIAAGIRVSMNSESKAATAAAIKLGLHTHIESLRTYTKELEGLPPCVSYFQKGKMKGYRIYRHANCENKRFTSKTISLEVLKQRTLTFIENIKDKSHQSNQMIRKTQGIQKGMIIRKTGSVYVEKVINKIVYSETFNFEDHKTNLICAEAYINKLMIQFAKPKKLEKQECSSETKWQSAYTEDVRKIVSARLKI